MNFYHRNRGAVSIFLIIVLVPCIVISSIFVDLGRVHLSRTQNTASADLALNTLLTNYDGDLKEWYGMIGSCQTIEEFYEVSAEYYLRNISSQGLSDEELMTLAGVFSAATGDDTIYDLMQVECQTETSAMISEVKGANLKNTTLLKDQVVEFMKYRAPIEIGKGLVGKLKGIMNGEASDDVGLGQFVESKENDALVTAKQNFYAAEGDLMTAAYYTYIAIYNYDQKYKELQLTEDKLQQYAKTINAYRDVYSQIHEISVQYLLTSGLNTYTRAVYSLEPYKDYDMDARSDVWSSKKTDEETDETTYYINGSDFDTIIKDIESKVSGFETAKANYESSVKGMLQISTTDSDVNIIQWWDDMQDAVMMYDGSVRSYGSSLLSCYTKLLVLLECEAEAVPNPKPQNYVSLPSDWESRCITLRDKIYNYVDKYLDGTADGNDTYVKAANLLTQVSNSPSNKSLLVSTNHDVVVDGQKMNIDTALKHMANNLATMRKNADDLIKLLDIAIYGDGDKTPSLSTLWTLASNYDAKFKLYDSAADTSTTKMGESERTTIDGMTLQSQINTTAVSDLQKRLVGIREQLNTFVTGIDNTKYGNTPIKAINSFASFKTQAVTKVAENSITVSISGNKKYASQTFSQLYKPNSGNAVTLLTTTGDSRNPDLNKSKPPLLEYMEKEFKDAINKKPQVEEGEKDEEKTEEEQSNFESTAKESANKYRGGGSGITTSEGSTTPFKASDLLSSVVGTVKSLVSGDVDGIRDDIYVTTYMMEMFSYATYDREAMYQLLSEEQRKGMLASDPEKAFKAAGVFGDASSTEAQEGTWLSTKESDTYNKSLTNHLINKTNNKSYLAEIEYILYGQATPQENLKKSFGHIYTIRMALNTVSGFQHFWGPGSDTGKAINLAATTISGVFGGIIPPPVIKAVLIPILALVETCMDNQRLAAGMPVELYKINADDWWLSLEVKPGESLKYSSFFSKVKGGLTAFEAGKNKDKGLFYSDYLMLFVYSGLAGGGDLENDMYVRMSELIEHNMRQQNGIPKDYSLSKTRMYFTLNATLRVKPLMVTLAYFDDYDSSMETATDWCTYTVTVTRGYT